MVVVTTFFFLFFSLVFVVNCCLLDKKPFYIGHVGHEDLAVRRRGKGRGDRRRNNNEGDIGINGGSSGYPRENTNQAGEVISNCEESI